LQEKVFSGLLSLNGKLLLREGLQKGRGGIVMSVAWAGKKER